MNKRIKIFWQKGITDEQIAFVKKSIEEFLSFVVTGRLGLVEVGREISVARYKTHFFSRKISLNKLQEKGLYWDKEGSYYSFILFRYPLFRKINKTNERLEGSANPFRIALLSTDFIRNMEFAPGEKKLKFIIFHELGHLFCLISPARRSEFIKMSFDDQMHCGNKNCVMYPYTDCFDEVDFNMPFCAVCLIELRDNFRDFSYFNSK